MAKIGQVELDELGDQDDEAGKGKSQSPRETRKDREREAQTERNLNDRLRACFDRIGDSLEERGDDELADIVREDARVMAGGLMSLTRPFKPLRSIVVLFVSVIEPALAFGRIVRVLASRWAQRRAEVMAEREAQNGGTPVT